MVPVPPGAQYRMRDIAGVCPEDSIALAHCRFSARIQYDRRGVPPLLTIFACPSRQLSGCAKAPQKGCLVTIGGNIWTMQPQHEQQSSRGLLTEVVSPNPVMPQVLDGEALCDLLGLNAKVLEGEDTRWQHMVLGVLDDVVCREDVVHWDRKLRSTAGLSHSAIALQPPQLCQLLCSL